MLGVGAELDDSLEESGYVMTSIEDCVGVPVSVPVPESDATPVSERLCDCACDGVTGKPGVTLWLLVAVSYS